LSPQEEFVLQVVADQGVRFVRLWFVDVIGRLKSIAIDSSDLEEAFLSGVSFDGSSIEGGTRVLESDMYLLPDASTFQMLPWRDGVQGDANGVARLFCDVLEADGTHAAIDSRNVLKRTVEDAQKLGYQLYASPEIEFYLFKNTPDLQPADSGGYFDQVPRGVGQDFRRVVITTLEEMGISVEVSHHEAGPGQNEIKLRSDNVLSAADNIITARAVIKETALKFDMQASFLPKPLADQPGSAMHTHFSLFQGDMNLFFDSSSKYNLSDIAKSFIAGVLTRGDDICAVTNQFINSYKRIFASRFEAPKFYTWGFNNSSAAIRVPRFKSMDQSSARFELRSLDTATNPYLSFALIFASGLEGVKEGLTPPSETTDNLHSVNPLEATSHNLKALPNSLEHAIEIFEKSKFTHSILGETVHRHILINKRSEIQEHFNQITATELRHVFDVV
jgi:glutamine synthetase